ncbi:glucosylglycerol-phosphate synthase [Pseudoroseomonas rhizosphaerae]|uniref:Glucosylglycerol-phosphate synthase n=1 Tax=Teichococcus rhizosphaerae TaxID=1335062 RepID=A0A2C7A2H3_9PROT|nr:glucosylglycerol-phosphate synthase [Pseudoroseomonas rhizosphaerae]PHK94268.1 glucosylglycerol-phosphate synthase [Pseudoroseomonas rhizosphaerae]
MSTKKSSLVIVYHRQPYEEAVEDGRTVFRPNRSPNGIVPTLKSFFQRTEPGAGAWVAWKHARPGEAFERVVHIDDVNGGYTVSRLPLTPEEVESFYHVTSKEALWPVLHSFPWLFSYDNVDWDTFRAVNRKFAEAAAAQAEDDAVIWVHDYNLWLVPAYLRALKPKARIAFFHHTPFPAADVFNILPWRQEILDSLLACDLVGFHIPRYARNFAELARALAGAEIAESVPVDPAFGAMGQALSEPDMPVRLRVGGRDVALDSAPVGTDAALIRSVVEKPASRAIQREIREGLGERRMIMAVGRTDYTKGMIEAMEGFERLLERRPELVGQVKLVVTSVRAAASMKVYDDTQRDIEATAGRINGRFSKLDWTPVVLFSNSIPFETLLSYYHAADICLTTPLRDGLNLVAKEYVAAKAGTPGALVLSEFAGCAVELPDAVLTNPYSRRNLDRALDEALDMPRAEAAERMRRMEKAVQGCDIACWADHVFGEFGKIGLAAPESRAAA